MVFKKTIGDSLITLDSGIPLLVVSDRIIMRKYIALILDFRRNRYEFFVTGVGGQLGHDVMNELLKRGHEGVDSDI